MQVWRFDIPLGDVVEVEMPRGAKPLEVGVQRGRPSLWALVNPAAEKVTRRLAIHGTGHEVSDDIGPYIGSFYIPSGRHSQEEFLVFHVFEAMADA